MVAQLFANLIASSGKTALQWFSFLVSTAYQIAQHNKLKREADKRKGFRINKRGEATHIPIVYGKQAVGWIEANHKVKSGYTYAAPGTGGTEFLSKKLVMNQNRSAKKNSLLVMNGAICQSGIEGVQSVEIDDIIYNVDKKHRHIFHTYNEGLSQTAPLGLANGLNADSKDHKFTKMAHATGAFKLNRNDYNYNGIPNVSFFVKGRKIRVVSRSGSSPNYTYALGGYIYSNNPAYVLLDYLLGDFGRNLDDNTTTPAGINLESFYNAAQVCDVVVMSNAEVFGTVNGHKPIEAWNNFSDFPGSPSGVGVSVTDEDVNENLIYQDLSDGEYYSFTETSRDDEENTITGTYSSHSVSTRNIPLYECNIVLDSEATVRDNIESILNTMPLASLSWTSEGQYKLQLAYPNTQQELENTNPNNGTVYIKKTLNNDNVIREGVDINWLPAAERYNSVTVTFLNEHKDFNEDSKTFPDKGTTAGNNLYQAYLTADNNQPMSTDMRLEGITDPYHALAHAEQILRESRTYHTLALTASKDAIGLEPGDYIKVELPLSNINDVYKINSVEVFEDLTIKINCHFVDINSFAWNVTDNDDPNVMSFNPTVFEPDIVTNLTFTTTALYNGVASGNLSWTAANSDPLYYIVQARDTDSTNNPFFDLGTVSGETTSFDITALNQASYTFAVRTVSASGQISKRVVIGPYNLLYTGPKTLDFIYAKNTNQASHSASDQSYDDTVSEATYPYFAAIDYKPDEQPTLPVTAANSGITLNFLPRTSKLVTHLTIYRRSTSVLATPSGGTYNFTTSEINNSGFPSGWFDSIPVGTGPIYISNATVEGFPTATAATIGTWSTPGILGQDGADGDTGGVLIIYATSSSGANKTTTYNNQEYVLYHEYVGTPPSVSSVTGTWVKFVGDNGTNGTNGTNGQAIWPIYATNSAGASQSFSVGSREYVTFYESVTQPTLPVSGQTFVKYVGDDGDDGAPGAVGNDAPRLSTVRVYIGATSQPSAPSATITWSTLAISNLTSNWSLTAPTIDASSTTTYYFSDISFVDATASATDTTSTGTTPTRSINFDGIVSFTNLNTRLADANTEIDGDRITTGTINADLVNVSNISATGIKPTITGSGQSNFAGEVTNLLYPFAYHGYNSKNSSQTGSSLPTSGPNSLALRDGDIFYNTSDNFTYRYDGTSWVKFSIQADSIISNYVYAGTVNATQINAGELNIDRLPGLSELAYDLSSGVSRVGDGNATSASVTATFSGLPADSKIVINAALGIRGPGGSNDTGQGTFSATSSGSFTVSAWNLASTSYNVQGSNNDPNKWFYHSGVATKSGTGSCSFTFTINSTYSRTTNINSMSITALAIQA